MVDHTQETLGRMTSADIQAARLENAADVSVPEPAQIQAKPAPSGRQPRPRKSWRRRSAVFVATLFGAAAILLLASLGYFRYRLEQGPIAFDGLGERIAVALEQRFGKGIDANVGYAAIEKSDHGPTLSIKNIDFKSANGTPILSAPRAEIWVDALSLAVGKIAPRRLELYDLEMRLVVMPDGAMAVSAGTNPSQAIVLSKAFGGDAPGLTPDVKTPTDGATTPSAAPSPATDSHVPPPAVTPHRGRSVVLKEAAAALRGIMDVLTASDSPIATIDRIGIARGKLVVEDQVANQTMVFDGLELSFDKEDGAAQIKLGAIGPAGRWSVNVKAAGSPGEQRTLAIAFKDISRDEISVATGSRSFGFDFNMPVSLNMRVVMGASNIISAADGTFSTGAGFLRFDDPDHEPILLDFIRGAMRWEPQNRRFAFDNTEFKAGTTRFVSAGSISAPSSEGQAWTLTGSLSEKGIFAPERPGEGPITFDRGGLTARLFTADRKIIIDRLEAGGPDSGVALSGEVDWVSGPHVKLGVSVSPMPVKTLLRLWPNFVAAPVRSWLLAHAKGGMVEAGSLAVDYNADDIRTMRADLPPPDASTLVEFKVSDGQLEFLPGVPPLTGVEGTGRVTGRTVRFEATKAHIETSPGRLINLNEATFTVTNSGTKSVPTQMQAKISGPLEAVSELLQREALKPYAYLPVDPNTLKGHVEGRLGLDFKIGKTAGAQDLTMKVDAVVTNFIAEKLLGKEKLDNGTINVSVDKGNIRASGQGRMFGAGATIDLRKPGNGPGEAVINLQLDEAARAKNGFGAIPGVAGPIMAKVIAPLGGADKIKANIELDLTRTLIDGLVPGLIKPAGRPAKLTFALTPIGDRMSLDNLVFDGGGMSARGQVDLDNDGTLNSLKLSSFKLSPGDDMRVDLTKNGDAMKIIVRASAIDARPFLKSLTGQGGDGSGGREAPQSGLVDLDLKSTLVTGNNKVILSNVDVKMTKRGKDFRALNLSGRFGREGLSAVIQKVDTGSPQLNVGCADAGSLLSFLDFYKRMEGGSLNSAIRLGDNRLEGVLNIKDFILRDEPAMRRLVAEGVPQRDGMGGVHIDPNGVSFNKLQGHFTRANGRIELRDAAMSGPNIGITIEGTIDYPRDRLDMSGTFVPAFALNNLITKIPVFGKILAGGSNEGIFGVNYRVSGAVSAPVLNINPLSAIAPGFLRKIFGAGSGGQAVSPSSNMPMQINPGGQ